VLLGRLGIKSRSPHRVRGTLITRGSLRSHSPQVAATWNHGRFKVGGARLAFQIGTVRVFHRVRCPEACADCPFLAPPAWRRNFFRKSPFSSADRTRSRCLDSSSRSLTRGRWPKAGRGRMTTDSRMSGPHTALPQDGGGIRDRDRILRFSFFREIAEWRTRIPDLQEVGISESGWTPCPRNYFTANMVAARFWFTFIPTKSVPPANLPSAL